MDMQDIIAGIIAIFAGVVSGIYLGGDSMLVRSITTGVVTILVFYFLQKPVKCPKCKTIMPKLRRPKNLRQFLWGGWTCPKCRRELDRKGKIIKSKKNL